MQRADRVRIHGQGIQGKDFFAAAMRGAAAEAAHTDGTEVVALEQALKARAVARCLGRPHTGLTVDIATATRAAAAVELR